jgi:GDSL-like Lipase/Acylhydrolase family
MRLRFTYAIVGAAGLLIALMPAATSAQSTVTPTPPFSQCPAVGQDTSCGLLLVVNPDNTISALGDPNQGPYDGADDTLVGIVNNSTAAVPAITVTGPGSGLSLLDDDGLCSYSLSGCPFGPTGYEGPDTTIKTDSALPDEAEIDFTGTGLAPGASAYFSLEGALTSASITSRPGTLPSPSDVLSLNPVSQNAATGSQATVTAQLQDSSAAPVAGKQISFRVQQGPDDGVTGTCTSSCMTSANGQATWSFTGSEAAAGQTDTVQAWLDANGDGVPSSGEPQTTATVTWAARTTSGSYVAMGDSYSSGEGAIDSAGDPAFDPATATSKDKCHRSAHAYAYQLKAALGFSDSNFKFVACSGAELADFVAKVGKSGQWTEGPQLNAIAPAGKTNPSIKLVTLSLGGNDVGFAQIMQKCVLGFGVSNSEQGCKTYAESTSAKGFKLLSSGGHILLHPNGAWSFCAGTGNCLKSGSHGACSVCHAVTVPSLVNLYGQIHKRAPNAKIRVLLYPLLFAATPPSDCTVGRFTTIAHIVHRYHVTKLEMTELNKLGNSLNKTISGQVRTARQAGVDIKAINPDNAVGPVPGFGGHAICDRGTPWINGLMWDGSFVGDISPFSFHPNALGQGEFGDEMQLVS